MTNQQAPEIYALHTVPNKGERPWSGIYAVRADAEHDAKVLRDATGRDWSVVRLVVADTATTPTGPITRYEVVDCIDSKHVPAVIPNGAGPWVRYEDHAAALCRLHAENEALRTQQQECGNTPYDEGPFALAQPAHQRDTGYPPLPECDATTVGLGAVWNRHSMRAYVDADRTARTQADSAQDEPLQAFDSPRAKALMRAWEEGWAACRDAEYVGEEAQNDAFNSSHTLTLCIAEDQQLPAPQADNKKKDPL